MNDSSFNVSGPLRVVTHNAFWFQGAPFEGEQPPAPRAEIITALAALYAEMEVDLLFLQEVQSERVLDVLSDILGMNGVYCPGNELPAYGGALLWRPGLLVRSSDSRGASVAPQRMWQMAEIDGPHGPALRVVGLHLPSDRGLPPGEGGRRRLEEVRALLDRSDTVDLLMGDLNEEPDGELGRYLSDHNYVCTSPPDDVEATALSGRRSDHIWVRADRQDRVVDAGMVASSWLRLDISGKQHLSDHLPLWVLYDMAPRRTVEEIGRGAGRARS
ncbi:MAG TPA: hypothetical protein GX702_15855 [Chloroflexi bacterium]|nr:hypothetical protein [Chloroflexota bacterium]